MLNVGQVARRVEPELRQEPFRGDECVGRTGLRAARTSRDQVQGAQTADQVAAHLPPQEFPQLPSADRLVIGDGREHQELLLRQGPHPIGEPDRAYCLGEALAGAMVEAAGDGDEVIGAVRELGADVVDEKVDIAVGSDDAGQRLAADGCGGGEYHGLDPAHPFAPAQLLRQLGELGIKPLLEARPASHAQSP